MKKYICLSFLLSLFPTGSIFPLSISPQEAHVIGERIWKNECAGTLEGLTNWNVGENFPSLGIGHFIWYPAAKREHFEETFPALVQFLEKEGASAPPWLKAATGCPWSTREEFNKAKSSETMNSLRHFLFDTRNLQAIFIATRLEIAFEQLLETCPPAEKDKVKANYQCISSSSNGWYALIDYLNFKGAGTSTQESYKGQGWGLLQVLQKVPQASTKPLDDFVDAAKTVLKQRVQNSPPERNEEQWLKGWFNRLDTYLK